MRHTGSFSLRNLGKSPVMQLFSDKLLFTPGPLSTSKTVKAAMLRDLGSRDTEFISRISYIREKLLETAGVSKEGGYEAVIIQGSGTFGIESVISSVIPRDGHLLVLINGAYGERISGIAAVHGIPQTRLVYAENEITGTAPLRAQLEKNAAITHVAVIHCETTTGIINPIEEIGKLCAAYGKTFIVDAMSSFGAYPVDMPEARIDFLISSSNKCIEGVPGFSFVIARRDSLELAEGRARTLSLDLYAQWKGLETDGQFRFTPPVQVLLAFARALHELEAEGGVKGRAARYARNNEVLLKGMQELGFRVYLDPEHRGYIITSFYYPDHPDFNFRDFYGALSQRGFVIYPGKLGKTDCFRIGNIGHITETDIRELLGAVRDLVSGYAITGKTNE